MTTRSRPSHVASSAGRALVVKAAREFRLARVEAGLSQGVVGASARISRAAYGRIERAEDHGVSIETLASVAAVLGLELSLGMFPAGDALRDAGHTKLLARLAARCHPSLRFATEVPLPRPGDRRAWDALIRGFPTQVRCGVEAETHPNDVQGLERKLMLKLRDGAVDRLILLLADTRHNRAFFRTLPSTFRERFPVRGSVAVARLAAGLDPGGNAIVLL
jgi:transcriptional regulator with XRE-family HTH domain